jgi:VanZ family protein
MNLRELLMQLALRPSAAQRRLASATLATLVALVFVLGRQPFAVGLLRAPWDKAAHGTLFFGLACLLWVIAGARRGHLVVAIAAALGAADELAQAFAPGRMVDWLDWVADTGGAALGIACLHMLRRVVATPQLARA